MTKEAIIIGIARITGHDGACLAEFLLKKGYEVGGIKRHASIFNDDRIDHVHQDPHVGDRNFVLHYGDLTNPTNRVRIIQPMQPDELYNLADISHVAVSFETPENTANADGIGTLRILEAIRILGLERKPRVCQTSTSELYGLMREPANRSPSLYPHNPYAVAKIDGYWITVDYRDAYGRLACDGIHFNHESPSRGETFVARKSKRAVSRVTPAPRDCLNIGKLSALRYWGHVHDYVEMQWLMLQRDMPKDFVIATGAPNSVRQFVEFACNRLGVEVRWEGEGMAGMWIVSSVGNTTGKRR